MYDVLVIGAGPAGSTAARVLAAAGLRVLLVERHKMPRNKSCSGVLIKKTLELTRLYFDGDVPAAATCTPAENRGMIFTNDAGKEYRFEQEGLNIWRGAFDHWLAQMAGECGAQVADGVSAVSCAQDKDRVSVVLKSEKPCLETARFVLCCEGAAGMLRRKGTGSAGAFITTYQTFCQGSIQLDPHYFYAYLQPELSEYDAWFNVKDGQLVLGVAVRDVSRLHAFHERFLAYMCARHGLKITRSGRSERWLMPRVRPGCPIDWGTGRVLLGGEAAGLLNPMGEGISAAMESGYCAARAIAENLDDVQAVNVAYRKKTANLTRYMRRQWSFVAGIAGNFQEMRLEEAAQIL